MRILNTNCESVKRSTALLQQRAKFMAVYNVEELLHKCKTRDNRGLDESCHITLFKF